MIQAILKGIINLIISLVQVVLLPIDVIIQTFLPDVSLFFNSVNTFLDLCVQSIGWVISALGLDASILSLLVLYYGFKLTVPLAISVVKLAIKWYNALKP